MRKYLLLLLPLALVLCLLLPLAQVTADAEPVEYLSPAISLSSDVLTAFAAQCDERYAQSRSQGILQASSQDSLLPLLAALPVSTGTDRDTLTGTLSSYGLYVFVPESNAQPGCGLEEVTVAPPVLIYHGGTRDWSVICGGAWQGDFWSEAAPLFGGDMGGPEFFGVRFRDSGNSYASLVNYSYAQLSDRTGAQINTTLNRSDTDGRGSFTFSLNDYIADYGLTVKGRAYVGCQWFGMCTYDPAFSQLSADLHAVYRHSGCAPGVSFRFLN